MTSEAGTPCTSVGDLLRGMHLPGTYAAPDIPAKKLANAREACAVAAETCIVGLLDTSMFGSAKECILFGEDRLWYRQRSQPAPGSISYTDLTTMAWQHGTFGEIQSSTGLALYIGGVSRDKAVDCSVGWRRWSRQAFGPRAP